MVRAVRTSNGLVAPVVFLYTFVATFEMTCGELLHAHSKDSWWYVYIAFRSLVFFGCGVILEYRLFFFADMAEIKSCRLT